MTLPTPPQPPHPTQGAHAPPSSAPPDSLALLIALIGLVTLIVGSATTSWIALRFDEGQAELTLNEVARLLPSAERGSVLGGFAHAYLQYWSAPTALVAALASLGATWPRPGHAPRRVLGRLATAAGLFGIVATVLLAASLNGLGVREGYWTECRVLAGPWVAVAGLALMLAGVRLSQRPGRAARSFSARPGAGAEATRDAFAAPAGLDAGATTPSWAEVARVPGEVPEALGEARPQATRAPSRQTAETSGTPGR
ncbi:hypothetical protein FH609_014495 [Streptomyces sp. 3MP-14]|uniref:Uncharacterized protein n=1 Tax=Streptomyces mimosae TaxID=2586635 RepID=A0A5N5ZWJ9_9ACTN|nr:MULTISPECIES: hypothetical protein [Streptomyces]KAB8160159.1 hypothetical protein FH607_027615 [Streptomyces mimosae]KAB8176672.1 hypothetical protein FH609_014495 [Streptomyces sp. 3MP-14]